MYSNCKKYLHLIWGSSIEMTVSFSYLVYYILWRKPWTKWAENNLSNHYICLISLKSKVFTRQNCQIRLFDF